MYFKTPEKKKKKISRRKEQKRNRVLRRQGGTDQSEIQMQMVQRRQMTSQNRKKFISQ